jgi:hypothetical protein
MCKKRVLRRPSPEHQGEKKQNQEYNEENLRNPSRGTRDPRKA